MDDQQKSKFLHYEETPEIDEKTGTPKPQFAPEHEITKPASRHSGLLSVLGNIMLFSILFAFGVGASVFLHQYLIQRTGQIALQPTPSAPSALMPSVTLPVGPYAGWIRYVPISSNSREPIAWISLKLPSDVVSPICDGQTCASQGTYLPGGTRLTVAPRGRGQALPTTIGAIMTDAGGRAFLMKEASVSGLPAQEFSGLFAGTTGGGYTFVQIRGFVVHGPEGISLEVNHFTPTGVNANWDTDDALFDKIVGTITFTAT